MKRETFNRNFAAMVSAYTIASKLSDESQDVYWDMLKEIPDDSFNQGVRVCLAECKFFPTISEIGDACLPVNGLGYNWKQQIERRKAKQVPLIDSKIKKLLDNLPF